MTEEEEDRGFLGVPGFLGDIFGGAVIPQGNFGGVSSSGVPVGSSSPAADPRPSGTISNTPTPLGRLVGDPLGIVAPISVAPTAGRTVVTPSNNSPQGPAGTSDERFAELLAAAAAGSGPQTSTTSSTSTSRVINEGAIRAAFEGQRDATGAAFGSQATSLEERMVEFLAQLSGIEQEELEGLLGLERTALANVDEQERIAREETERQHTAGREQIATDLTALLAVLAGTEQNIRAEGAATSGSIADRAVAARTAAAADTARLAEFGGGDRLAAAAQSGADVASQITAIDAGLADRLQQVGVNDAQRRVGSANFVANSARGQLEETTLQLLGELAAQSAAQRGAIGLDFAGRRADVGSRFNERELDTTLSFEDRIAEARLQQDLALAQRFVPEPVRQTSNTSTTTSSGGGGSALNPLDQIELGVLLDQREAQLRDAAGLGPPPSALESAGISPDTLFAQAAAAGTTPQEQFENVVSVARLVG